MSVSRSASHGRRHAVGLAHDVQPLGEERATSKAAEDRIIVDDEDRR
jgi:hypothetical protein